MFRTAALMASLWTLCWIIDFRKEFKDSLIKYSYGFDLSERGECQNYCITLGRLNYLWRHSWQYLYSSLIWGGNWGSSSEEGEVSSWSNMLLKEATFSLLVRGNIQRSQFGYSWSQQVISQYFPIIQENPLSVKIMTRIKLNHATVRMSGKV